MATRAERELGASAMAARLLVHARRWSLKSVKSKSLPLLSGRRLAGALVQGPGVSSRQTRRLNSLNRLTDLTDWSLKWGDLRRQRCVRRRPEECNLPSGALNIDDAAMYTSALAVGGWFDVCVYPLTVSWRSRLRVCAPVPSRLLEWVPACI